MIFLTSLDIARECGDPGPVDPRMLLTHSWAGLSVCMHSQTAIEGRRNVAVEDGLHGDCPECAGALYVSTTAVPRSRGARYRPALMECDRRVWTSLDALDESREPPSSWCLVYIGIHRRTTLRADWVVAKSLAAPDAPQAFLSHLYRHAGVEEFFLRQVSADLSASPHGELLPHDRLAWSPFEGTRHAAPGADRSGVSSGEPSFWVPLDLGQRLMPTWRAEPQPPHRWAPASPSAEPTSGPPAAPQRPTTAAPGLRLVPDGGAAAAAAFTADPVEAAVNAFRCRLTEEVGEGALPLAEARELGDRAARIVASGLQWLAHIGDVLPLADAQRLLRITSRQGVYDLVKRRRLLGLRRARGGMAFPAFQFSPTGRPWPAMEPVLAAFAEADVDPYAVASWFNTEQDDLQARPADLLADPTAAPRLADAARRTADRWAQ